MRATQTDETETTGGPETTQLHIAYPTAPPDFTAFDVKTLTPETLLGVPCTVAVVGQSHVVTAPNIGYHEVCSCVPQSAPTSETVALDHGVTGQVDARGSDDGTVRATTDLSVRPLSSFPGPEGATLAYRFGPEAWTTVTVEEERGYETYHTYPEHDVAVRTVTRLSGGPQSRVGADGARVHTPDPTPRRTDR